MHRNLDRRVEVLVSITNPAHIAEIEELFDIAFDEGTASWQLQPDGTWIPHTADAAVSRCSTCRSTINASSRRRAAAKCLRALGEPQPDPTRRRLRAARSWPAAPS